MTLNNERLILLEDKEHQLLKQAFGSTLTICNNNPPLYFLTKVSHQAHGFQHFPAEIIDTKPFGLIFDFTHITNTLESPMYLHMDNVNIPLNAYFFDEKGDLIHSTFMDVNTHDLFAIPVGTKYILEIPKKLNFISPNNLNEILNSCHTRPI